MVDVSIINQTFKGHDEATWLLDLHSTLPFLKKEQGFFVLISPSNIYRTKSEYITCIRIQIIRVTSPIGINETNQ